MIELAVDRHASPPDVAGAATPAVEGKAAPVATVPAIAAAVKARRSPRRSGARPLGGHGFGRRPDGPVRLHGLAAGHA